MKTIYLTTDQLEQLAEEYLPTYEVACKWPDLSAGRDVAADLGFGNLTRAQHATAIQIAQQKWQALKLAR